MGYGDRRQEVHPVGELCTSAFRDAGMTSPSQNTFTVIRSFSHGYLLSYWNLLSSAALSSQCTWHILQPCRWKPSPSHSRIWHENQVRLITVHNVFVIFMIMSDTANCWLGIYNTASLLFLLIHVNSDCYCITVQYMKHSKTFSNFSSLLLCVHTHRYVVLDTYSMIIQW